MQAKEHVKKQFDDAPIGKRLKVAFYGIASAILFVTCIALFMLVDQRERINILDEYVIKMIENAWSTKESASKMQNYVNQLSMTNDKNRIQKYEQELKAVKNELYSSLDTLSTGANTTESKNKLNKIEPIVQEMIAIENEIISLGHEGKNEEAAQIMEEKYISKVKEIGSILSEICDLVDMEKDKYIKNSNIRALCLMVLLVLISAVIMFQARRLSRRVILGITKPIDEVEQAMEALAKGDLDYELKYHSKNEIGRLAKKIRETEKELKKYIKNIDYVANKMAEKDFTVTVDIDYRGSFANIKTSFLKIIELLNHITLSIRNTAVGVKEGSEQMSEVSQELADGTNDQSGTVEELQASLSDVSGQVEINAKDVHEVSNMASDAQIIINQGNEHMRNLVEAMNEISQSSEQIENIITVIEGISGQTNMLALNASIESARAGEQGKGFAVVAGEIGKLATETKEATKTTTSLIHRSLSAVQKGVELVNETAEILTKVVQSASKITDLADNVSGASAKQAKTIEEIHKAVEQISEVVQGNVAIAQEAASSSQELTSHATVLSDILEEFKL